MTRGDSCGWDGGGRMIGSRDGHRCAQGSVLP